MDNARTRRVIAAGMIGNVLEWYDFAIYGYFASQIGRQFFPHEVGVEGSNPFARSNTSIT
jgi:MFS transporter, MHS family, proline/betaine transporter